MGAMGRGTTASTSEYRSFFPTIVRSTLRKLKYGNVGREVCTGVCEMVERWETSERGMLLQTLHPRLPFTVDVL